MNEADVPPLPSPERLQELMGDAARIGRNDVIPALLRTGIDINARDANGYTPLILASYNDRGSTTALLITEGADVNLADGNRGNTPLMGVVFKGYDAIARALIDAGADVNKRNHAGQTALMMAALFGRDAIVDMLLRAGADASARDNAENDAIGVARAQGNVAMAERLQG